MDLDPASQLIAYLNRGGGKGYYWLKLPPNNGQEGLKRTIWFDAGKPPAWPEGSYDLYFGVHPTRDIPKRLSRKTGKPVSPHLLRATLPDIAAINCLFAEFDAKLFTGGKEEARQHIRNLRFEPNILIDSGGGYHAYWLLCEPVPIPDEFHLKRLAAIQARWVDHVAGDPDSKDLARVLRVPGSYNYKYDPPREVSFIYAEYEPFELADLVKSMPSVLDPAPTINPMPHSDKPSVDAWLKGALNRASVGSRNATGFWLACQLRDNGIPQAEALAVAYPESVPQQSGNEYTRSEWEKTVTSAYASPARGGAIDRNPVTDQVSRSAAQSQPVVTLPGSPAPVKSQNGNGKANGDKQAPDPGPAAAQSVTKDGKGVGTWELVYLESSRVRDALEAQEVGDAELLAEMYRGQVCYDHAEGAWYIWKKHFWERDQTGFVYRLVPRRVSPQYLQAAAEAQAKGLEDLAKKLASRAAALRNKKRIDNVLFLAARHEHLALKGDEWDANPWLLGCTNGVVELKTGALRPGDPADYIRAHTKVKFPGLDAECPRWSQFLQEIFQDDSIAAFMRRLFGYGITGLTVHHLFPILWGQEGRNGKGTMLETIGNVLGSDLAISSQADALMDMNKSGEGPKPFIYNLRGKRLVWASESNEGRRINEGLVKQLTGGDRLNVRTLHSKPVEFFPSHLLMLITNHKPHINADGSAIWRRVFLIPFEQEFIDQPDPAKPNQHQADPYLIETLKTEQPGILAWLVNGCLEWQRDGLNPPEKIMAATQDYREEEDTTGIFIAEKCLIQPGLTVKAGMLYKAYSDWCKDCAIQPMSLTAFGKLIKKKYPARESNGVIYQGIGLQY